MTYSIVFIDGADERGSGGRIPYKGRHCFLRPPKEIAVSYGASLVDARERLATVGGPVLMFLHFNGADVRRPVVNDESVAIAAQVIERGGLFVWFSGQGAADAGFFSPFRIVFGPEGASWACLFGAGERVLKGLVLPADLTDVRSADLPELTPITRVPGYPELVALTENDLPADSPDPFDTIIRGKHRTAYRFLEGEDRSFVDNALGGAGSPPHGPMSQTWLRVREGALVEAELLAAAQEELRQISSRLTAAQVRDELGRKGGCTCGGERML